LKGGKKYTKKQWERGGESKNEVKRNRTDGEKKRNKKKLKQFLPSVYVSLAATTMD